MRVLTLSAARLASLAGSSQGVLQDEDDTVAAQEHLGDESVLVHRFGFLCS